MSNQPSNQQVLQVRYDDLKASYANHVLVSVGAEEVYLDFTSGIVADRPGVSLLPIPPQSALGAAGGFFSQFPRVIRTAFVLGAGLGTRLKSLTARRPKPLIPVANRPLITYAFDHLLGVGVERLVVNMHWRSEVYARAFPEAIYRGAPLSFCDEQPEVLETAGGI